MLSRFLIPVKKFSRVKSIHTYVELKPWPNIQLTWGERSLFFAGNHVPDVIAGYVHPLSGGCSFG